MTSSSAPAIRFAIRAKVADCYALDGKWWLRIEDSWESLSLGPALKEDDGTRYEPPPFYIGQPINVVVEGAKV